MIKRSGFFMTLLIILALSSCNIVQDLPENISEVTDSNFTTSSYSELTFPLQENKMTAIVKNSEHVKFKMHDNAKTYIPLKDKVLESVYNLTVYTDKNENTVMFLDDTEVLGGIIYSDFIRHIMVFQWYLKKIMEFR